MSRDIDNTPQSTPLVTGVYKHYVIVFIARGTSMRMQTFQIIIIIDYVHSFFSMVYIYMVWYFKSKVWYFAINVQYCAINLRYCAINVWYCAIKVWYCAINVQYCAINLWYCAMNVWYCAINVTLIPVHNESKNCKEKFGKNVVKRINFFQFLLEFGKFTLCKY